MDGGLQNDPEGPSLKAALMDGVLLPGKQDVGAAFYGPSFIQKTKFNPLIFWGPEFLCFASQSILNPDLLGPYLSLSVCSYLLSAHLSGFELSFFSGI